MLKSRLIPVVLIFLLAGCGTGPSRQALELAHDCRPPAGLDVSTGASGNETLVSNMQQRNISVRCESEEVRSKASGTWVKTETPFSGRENWNARRTDDGPGSWSETQESFSSDERLGPYGRSRGNMNYRFDQRSVEESDWFPFVGAVETRTTIQLRSSSRPSVQFKKGRPRPVTRTYRWPK